MNDIVSRQRLRRDPSEKGSIRNLFNYENVSARAGVFSLSLSLLDERALSLCVSCLFCCQSSIIFSFFLYYNAARVPRKLTRFARAREADGSGAERENTVLLLRWPGVEREGGGRL